MINRTIRNFRITELIATGGMAAIYKAVQLSLDRTVAIKILHGHLAQNKDFITRFEREARASANLRHENIVKIIDYGKEEEVYFIAMEYVEGKSLKELINTFKFIPQDIALTIVIDIARGLAHAHEKGVVHRDVKPANVLIGNNGTVKIADFGLAQTQELISITITGSIVGTPAYMSPEQAVGKKVDCRSDIFSLGVVIYEMLTGIKPFSGGNYSAVIHEILTIVPPKPSEVNPLINKDVSSIIGKMLEKDPEKRYQNIGSVIEDINSFMSRSGINVSKKEIGEFINTPKEHFDELLKKRKARHFEHGLYYMTLGFEKIDDAIREFNRVVHLDPDNQKAKKYIEELNQRKQKKTRGTKKIAGKEKSFLIPLAAGIAVLALIFVFLIPGLFKNQHPHKAKGPVFGVVNINSLPPGADIFVNDKETGNSTPAQIQLQPGKYTIKLKKSGYLSYLENIALKGNDTLTLQARLNKQEAKLLYSLLRVKSNPAGARVNIDNIKKTWTTPCNIRLPEGRYRIRLIKKGYESAVINRIITANETTSVSLNLKKKKKKENILPVRGDSYLKITVNPWAKIYIDGKYIETTPIARPIKLKSGNHTIRLSNPNFKSWRKIINFKPGETKTLEVNLKPEDGYLKLIVKPWADVYIDGKFYETTPIAKPIKLPAGPHGLKLINPLYKIYETQINITANRVLKKIVQLRPK